MKIGRIACGAAIWLGFTACAHSPEAAPPAASAKGADFAAAPAAEASEAPAGNLADNGAPTSAAPASPAPAPQGLDDQKSKAPAAEEFTSLEAAERALNQAKADLDRLALAEPAPVIARSAPAAKKESKSAQPTAAGATASSAPSPLCENACRAFSSLSRAASAVCRLDGNNGAHCTRAKRVVADSQQRVASCSCSTSGD